MKKITKLFTVLLSAAFLFSCNNSFNNDFQNEDAQIILSIKGAAGRTAFADVPVEKIANIKLEYRNAGKGDYSTLVTYQSIASISSAEPVYVNPDTYDLRVTANAGCFVYKAEKTAVELVRGENQFSVELVLNTMETPAGNGTFELNFAVPGISNNSIMYCNYAEYSLYVDNSVLSDYAGIPLTATPDEATLKVNFTASSIATKALAEGMYDIVVKFYADEYKTIELTSFEDSLQIVDGVKTSKDYAIEHINFDLNELEIGPSGSDAFYVKKGNAVYFCGEGVLDLSEEQIEEMEAYFNGETNYFVFGTDILEAYIGDGITELGEGFFTGAENLKKVYGAENVTKINDVVFADLFLLEEIPSFSKVIYIGEEAFSECHSLTHLPEFTSVTYLGKNAFYHCTGLEEINGFNKVTELGIYVFSECENLTKITGFNAVTELPVNAINFKQLKTH